MRIPGIKSMRRFSRWLKSRFLNGVLVLGYHRITDVDFDPYSLSVSPRNFAEQLEIICENANPIGLSTLADSLYRGEFPKRSIMLTFDDGYADVLHHAKPLLEQFEVPAITFVVTGYLGCEFWWDELERIISCSQSLSKLLTLEINEGRYDWNSNHLKGSPIEGSDSKARQRLILSLCERLMLLPHNDRKRVLLDIHAHTGDDPKGNPKYRALNQNEVKELTDNGLVEVGSHSVTHPVLESQQPYQRRIEIQQSKTDLEDLLNRPINSFSFPNGSVPKDVRAILVDAGYKYGFTSLNDIFRPNDDPYFIPRFWVPDWDGEKFNRWLKLWL